MEKKFQLDWVCTEGDAAALSRRIAKDGGQIEGRAQFEPPPDEIDLYADAQFGPMTVVTALVAASLAFKLIRETIKDLRGRQVLILDVSGDTVTSRMVSLAGADHVIVKSAAGAESFAVTQTAAIEKMILEALGK